MDSEGEAKGTCNRKIAETAGVSVHWIQKLWRRYKDKDKISYPLPMGKSRGCAPGHRERSAALSAAMGRDMIRN